MCFKNFFKGVKAAREVQKSDGLDGMMWCTKCKNTQPVYKDKFRNRRCFACHSPVSIDSKGAIDVSSTPADRRATYELDDELKGQK